MSKQSITEGTLSNRQYRDMFFMFDTPKILDVSRECSAYGIITRLIDPMYYDREDLHEHLYSYDDIKEYYLKVMDDGGDSNIICEFLDNVPSDISYIRFVKY